MTEVRKPERDGERRHVTLPVLIRVLPRTRDDRLVLHRREELFSLFHLLRLLNGAGAGAHTRKIDVLDDGGCEMVERGGSREEQSYVCDDSRTRCHSVSCSFRIVHEQRHTRRRRESDLQSRA